MGEKTALITGISGFTGAYVERRLRTLGYRVFGFVHRQADTGEDRFCVDLCDQDKVDGLIAQLRPQVVVHLAAVSFVAHGVVSDIYNSNIMGTRNLLSALSRCEYKLSTVILASSANVYGNSSFECLTEETPLAPANDYAVSKVAMEAMAELWRDKLPIVIVRPFNYSGVGQSERFLLPKIVTHFSQAKKLIELGNLDVYRDFSDVRTVADTYCRIIECGIQSGIFNICSGQVYSLAEIIELMSDISGYEIDVQINPDFVRENEIKYLKGSNKALQQTIGSVQTYSMKETLSWMYQSKVGN